MKRDEPAGRVPRQAVPYGVLLVGVLLVAANLRAVIAAVGPILPTIGRDTGMSPSQLGIVAATPVAAFALCSPLVHTVAQRFGADRTVFGAMVLLAAGTLFRSLPSESEPALPLTLGTFVIGATIAVGNVLLPVVVRRDFPDQVPRITGHYIAVQSIVAGLASALVVPASFLAGSWRIALAVWGVLIPAALAWWIPRLLVAARPADVDIGPAPGRAAVLVWRSPLAWQVACYFGVQSTSFYVLLSWLPTVEQDMGVSPSVAGAHLSVYLVVGVIANLAVPPLLARREDQRTAAVVVPTALIGAMAGFLLVPALTVVWVALSGLAVGGSMVLSLSLISLRGGGGTATSRLSSMVQAVAYTGVAGGLFVAGWIREIAGPGQDILVYVLVLSTVQAALGLRVGRSAQLS